MASERKRVAVLGAGVSGLAATKTLLEEGVDVVCFESRSFVGGVWSGTKDQWSEQGPTMYRSLISNTSKSMTCFSDFPCPESYPPYLPYPLYREYLQSYAEYFCLLQHIKLSTRVLRVDKAADYDESGKWRLRITESKTSCKHGSDDKAEEENRTWDEVFDGVVVASGFYNKARSPDYPGLRTSFTGSVFHACHYKDAVKYMDKTVLVIGNLNSAGDIACDISSYATQVYLSTGDGTCILGRISANGMPFDHKMFRALKWLPTKFLTPLLVWTANRTIDHKTLDIEYKGRNGTPVMVNDFLKNRILCGKVKVLGHLSEFRGSSVITKDGNEISGIDSVIFATGYSWDMSLLDPNLKLVKGEDVRGKVELYKQVFPVHEKHHTLAFVGFIRLAGPMPPTLELQARLAAYTLSGRHKLPSPDVMMKDCNKYNAMARRHDGSYKYAFPALLVYEDLAAEIGVTPSFWSLCLAGKPRLAYKALFGPCFPFLYRLVGPGAWSGAEQAIELAIQENHKALNSRRQVKTMKNSTAAKFVLVASVLSILKCAVYLNNLYS